MQLSMYRNIDESRCAVPNYTCHGALEALIEWFCCTKRNFMIVGIGHKDVNAYAKCGNKSGVGVS